jgi:UDP-galactopyranose mutase
MKTIEYTIKSDSWGNVQLPQEPFEKAKELIEDLSKPKSGIDLLNFVGNHLYLTNESILNLAKEFITSEPYSKKALALQDELFLSISMDYINNTYAWEMNHLKEEYEKAEKDINGKYKSVADPIMKMIEKFKLKENMGKN